MLFTLSLVDNNRLPTGAFAGGDEFVSDSYTAALYHFNDLDDSSGNGYSMSLAGNAQLVSDNLRWMNSPNGKALRTYGLSDYAVVSIPDYKLMPSYDDSYGLTFEVWFYPIAWKAYKEGDYVVLGIRQADDTQLIVEDGRRNNPRNPHIRTGTSEFVSDNEWEKNVAPNMWHALKLIYKNGQTQAYIDDVLIGVGSGYNFNYDRSNDWILMFGNFDGYIDEARISPVARDGTEPAALPSPYCGDNKCNREEICSTCPIDCGSCPGPALGPDCGDTTCEVSRGEDCNSCSKDCGVCLSLLEGGELIGHWKFDEGSGTIAKDSSGNGNDGSLKEGTSWTEGKIGNAVIFDGNRDYVDVRKLDINGDEMTIAAWVNPNDLTNKCSYEDCSIIAKSDGKTESLTWWMLSTKETRKVMFRLKTENGVSTLVSNKEVFENNKWTHVAAVYDGTNMILYADGNEVGRTSKKGDIAQDYTVRSWIGAIPRGRINEWSGKIDDARIYSKALSRDEIQGLAGI